MRIANPDIPVLSEAVLTDKAFGTIGTKLKAALPWLTNAYRRAERLPRKEGTRTLHEPLVFVGRDQNPNDYLNMLPDTHLGNHCFFYVTDGENVNYDFNGIDLVNIEFALIFWFDYRTVYNDHLTRSIENVRTDIYNALSSITSPSFDINKSYTEARNIYKEFDHKEVDSQFLMRPYGGLRFEGTMRIKPSC